MPGAATPPRHHRVAAEGEFCLSGDLVEYGATPYCGDAHFQDWPATLDRLEPWAPPPWCRAAARR